VKYLSVLHPDCDYFWQRPKPIEKKTVDIWFDKAPLGNIFAVTTVVFC
jgi:hypothetical protein